MMHIIAIRIFLYYFFIKSYLSKVYTILIPGLKIRKPRLIDVK